jgi:Trypsin-like serine proteases, typically periplasmic, contain C-terminal PDZ domain
MLRSATCTLILSLGLAWPLAGQSKLQGPVRLNAKVLASFQSIISEPAKSTVQVYCDNYRGALGTVVRADGYVVTKASELKGKLLVQVHGSSDKLPAQIVATDLDTDLALLKIEAQGLPVVAWSADPVPPVGSWLATPGMFDSPEAIGVVSVAPRKIARAGGALGIRLGDDDKTAQIIDVTPGFAAAKAGIQVGDIVRQLNGKAINGRDHLIESIKAFEPDDKIDLVVERDGKQIAMSATLSNRTVLMAGERAGFQNGLGGSLSKRRAGFPLALQHDTVLTPNQCGGPIVDLDGKVVGLNIARAGRVESYALPASVAQAAIEKLLVKAAPMSGDAKFVDKKSPSDSDKKIQ